MQIILRETTYKGKEREESKIKGKEKNTHKGMST